MQEQERNLKTYLNNIPYDQKEVVQAHILRLIRENELWIRTGVAKNIDDTFYCYIQITGFVKVGDALIEIKILFPHNYPIAPPQFHLKYESEAYSINNEQALLNDRVINFEVDPANERFVNLKFPFLMIYWKNERRNVTEAYAEMQKCLNNPPLLVARKEQRRDRTEDIRASYGGIGDGSLVDRFMTEVELQALLIQEAQDKVEKEERLVDYSLSRVDFFKRNLPKLSRSMKNYEEEVSSQVAEMQSISESLSFQRNPDPLLELSPPVRSKLALLGSREGYIEAERRLWRCLQTELQQAPSRFKDFRPLIRTLYEGMFTSQSAFLRASD